MRLALHSVLVEQGLNDEMHSPSVQLRQTASQQQIEYRVNLIVVGVGNAS